MKYGLHIPVALIMLISCGPKTADQQTSGDSTTGETSVTQRNQGYIANGISEDTTQMKSLDTALLSQRTSPLKGDVLLLTIPEILKSPEYVGKTVRVEGRCLGYGKVIAEGGPPLTRSDWQLEDDGVAIYVSGPLPESCSATLGSNQKSVINAIVAEDTIRALGSSLATPRRYLIRLLEESGED